MENLAFDFSRVTVLVLGDIMLDEYIWGSVTRISPEAPIPVVCVKDKSFCLGGAGNVAANLSGLGCQAVLMGIIGKDKAGSILKTKCEQANIIRKYVMSESYITITKTRVMSGGQQLVRIDEEADKPLCQEKQNAIFENFIQMLPNVQAVILSDYGKGIFSASFLQQCIASCKQNDVPVLVDPKTENWAAYAGATCITPNLQEFWNACLQVGCSDHSLDMAGQYMCDRFGLNNLLVTRGAEGMSLFQSDGVSCNLSTQAWDVFDVSGAGDTVLATLAAGVGSGLSFNKAMVLANLAAGVVVGKVGTYAVTYHDLDQAITKSPGSGAATSLEQARHIVEQWRMQGLSIVFTNGCFDLLHPGHIHLLKEAKKLGDRLIVGVNSDDSVRRLKGDIRPVIVENDRASILSALKSVDLVVLFTEDTPARLISELKPHILVKGSDYNSDEVVGHNLVAEWGGRVELVKLFDGQSSSNIVEKIRNCK